MAEDPFTHYHLAEAASLIEAVRTRLFQSFDEFMAVARAGRELSLERRAPCR